MTSRELLHSKGYTLLFGAVPTMWLAALRIAFDTGIKPSNEWPVPRGIDWRHSQLDTDPVVQALCRLPPLLAVVGELIGERFFLSQVEGREPLINGGQQQLHQPLFDFTDESRSVQLTGSAGDILIFDADLIHAGSLNASGARRRTLLITCFSDSLYATHLETVGLRSIQMDTTERFDPEDFVFKPLN